MQCGTIREEPTRLEEQKKRVNSRSRIVCVMQRGLITRDSLKRNTAALGLQGLGDDDLLGMLREGDLNGDGALDQMEFCVLMVRLNLELMEKSNDRADVITLEWH
ncbi:hypothetical protein Cni_G28995 [Canna indica]|uniref:EF-hand domain-containing protein n=1 Tax=Canna indica TaxID=4628 RepID=A0AAQ3LAT4_9LILI|nr:hypothetical protein Cni_G28995 [Canna indica]